MEGRIVLVKLLCKDTANARIGVFSPCIAFRVAGSPGKTLNSFDSFTNSSLDEDDDAMDLSLHPFTRLLRRAFASSGTPSAHPCNPQAKSEQSQNSFLFFFSFLVRVDGNQNKRTFRHTHLYYIVSLRVPVPRDNQRDWIDHRWHFEKKEKMNLLLIGSRTEFFLIFPPRTRNSGFLLLSKVA